MTKREHTTVTSILTVAMLLAFILGCVCGGAVIAGV